MNSENTQPASNSNPSTANLKPKPPLINWSPWLAVAYVVAVYIVSQVLGALIVLIYPALQGWSTKQSEDWLNSSITAQFFYILIAETLVVLAIYIFLRLRGRSLSVIGVKRPKWWHLALPVLIVPVYYVLYAALLAGASALIPGLNTNQRQELGFNNPTGTLQLFLTFVSLVVLPPLVEELLMRGYLYTSLRKALSYWPAALITSAIFASGHLQFGSGAPLLWVAAIDTFVLSLFLVWLREKTGNIWASVVLHALKNSIAFVSLFVLHLS